uniref:Uncharacterized protein n=1 Tax=Nothoprocta perdicaria TaxID=30464 RepID=A0A8C6ZQ75_NOTPE
KGIPGRKIYGLILPQKTHQKNLVTKKLSVFADDSDEEANKFGYLYSCPTSACRELSLSMAVQDWGHWITVVPAN